MSSEKAEKAGKSPGQPGRFGRFYLQELINSGGVSDIWVATDPQGQAFALRRFRSDSQLSFMDRLEARRRFFRGCEVLSKMRNHEKIIGYVEHGKIEGDPYLLMEYVEGSNLKQLLGRTDPILAENVAQILIDTAAGLEQMHDCGFMHLDFKPENVVVTRNASVRLVDFDLAQPIPEAPVKIPGKNAGTPAYMAPEQLLHQPIDQRADIFAFGVTAYELLTYAKPFPGESPDEILRKEQAGELIPPRELNPEIPVALENIILKCIKPEMAQRYPYMSVVVRDLEAALYVP
jgi:eukaryotic-like serine/threonine-protein kinase